MNRKDKNMAKLTIEEIEEKLIIEKEKARALQEKLNKQNEIVKKLEDQKEDIEKTKSYQWQKSQEIRLNEVGLSFKEIKVAIEELVDKMIKDKKNEVIDENKGSEQKE